MFFLDINNWANLPESFLDFYDTVVTSASLSISIKDLTQRAGERVIDYNARSMAVFNKYYDKNVDDCQDVNQPRRLAFVTNQNTKFAR